MYLLEEASGFLLASLRRVSGMLGGVGDFSLAASVFSLINHQFSPYPRDLDTCLLPRSRTPCLLLHLEGLDLRFAPLPLGCLRRVGGLVNHADMVDTSRNQLMVMDTDRNTWHEVVYLDWTVWSACFFWKVRTFSDGNLKPFC